MKYLAVIYFEAPEGVNAEKALEVAVERLESYAVGVKVQDSHIEEDDNE